MFRKTKLCTGLMLAFGSGAVLMALPAAAQQRIEITGSAIKRVQSEGPAPVETYTRKDIERTGATTISELVKNIASLDIDDQGELTGNSPSGSGTQNLQIRGLSERNLLVLLNGRRLPVNALHDGSGAGAAVDVNNIPLSAVERVEILKDGGSAIYGADAVAGVINFITRKNFTGLEARAGFGISSEGDAKETPLGLLFGMGDYDAQGFNFLAALDYIKRDPLARTARDITSSADWRRYENGNVAADGRSTFHPVGNIVAGAGAPGQLIACPPADLRAGLCRFDFNKSILTSINGADRLSTMLIGNFKLGGTRLFAEYIHSESKDKFEAQPAPGVYVDAQGRTIRARFMQIGPRTTNRKSSLDHIVVGAEGSFGSMDWDLAVGQGTSKITNNDSNYADATLFTDYINRGLIDPTSTTNPTAVVDQVRLTPSRSGKSVLKFVQGKLSGPITDLAGGPLAYAVGFSFIKESLSDRPDAQQQAGNVFGSIPQAAVDASRSYKAVFGELSVPFMKGVEAQIAARYDKYPAYQRTSPKLAVKWTPTSSFAVRGSYSESFLAPSLKQLFGGQESGAESTSDPDICGFFPTLSGTCDNFPYQAYNGSNANLQPETGKTINIGLLFEPAPYIALGVDFFQIKKQNEIGQPSVLTALRRGNFSVVNGEARVLQTLDNVAATKVEGVELDVRVRLGDTPLGKLSLRNSFTYYKTNQTQFDVGDPFYNYAGTWLNPRWRNNLSVSLEKGPWLTTATVRSTPGFWDTTLPIGEFNRATTRVVNPHEETDINVQYTGIKNLTLSGTVKNLFDRLPPYARTGTLNQYGSMGFPWIYSPRGRFFQVGVNYKFF